MRTASRRKLGIFVSWSDMKVDVQVHVNALSR